MHKRPPRGASVPVGVAGAPGASERGCASGAGPGLARADHRGCRTGRHRAVQLSGETLCKGAARPSLIDGPARVELPDRRDQFPGEPAPHLFGVGPWPLQMLGDVVQHLLS